MTKYRIVVPGGVHEVEDDSSTDAISKVVADLQLKAEEVKEDTPEEQKE